MTLFNIQEGHTIKLPQCEGWPESVHVFSEKEQWAIHAALAARRPLLVRGRPGCGKSQLARAAALVLKRVFMTTVVHARSESSELQYHFDALERLGEAQTIGAAQGEVKDVSTRLDPEKYLLPGPLWWAFNPGSARALEKKTKRKSPKPIKMPGCKEENGCVLLIDEIDKAEPDLPNGLLETLGQGAFHVPFLEKRVEMQEPEPLIVITTNEERELPAAFLRRCLVLMIVLPTDKDKLQAFLIERGKAHYGDTVEDGVYKEAARQLSEDREAALNAGLVAPGQAEHLDLLKAVVDVAKKLDKKQKDVLAKIAEYTFSKDRPVG
jgi:MoxR-like ATPase